MLLGYVIGTGECLSFKHAQNTHTLELLMIIFGTSTTCDKSGKKIGNERYIHHCVVIYQGYELKFVYLNVSNGHLRRCYIKQTEYM